MKKISSNGAQAASLQANTKTRRQGCLRSNARPERFSRLPVLPQEDAVFLLNRKGLVNHHLIKEHIIKTAGSIAWGLAKHGYQRWYDLADGRRREEQRNEKEGYIDS